MVGGAHSDSSVVSCREMHHGCEATHPTMLPAAERCPDASGSVFALVLSTLGVDEAAGRGCRSTFSQSKGVCVHIHPSHLWLRPFCESDHPDSFRRCVRPPSLNRLCRARQNFSKRRRLCLAVVETRLITNFGVRIGNYEWRSFLSPALRPSPSQTFKAGRPA